MNREVRGGFHHEDQNLTKYGMATSAIPIATSRRVFATKYGNIMRASPQTSGTTARCFLPYRKKPSPIEPKSRPQRSHDSFNVSRDP